MPTSDFNRRKFLVTKLSMGFAAATLPITAQTAIHTGTEGLTAGEVSLPVNDGSMPAYRAMPAKDGPFPVVLVIQEIFGVHEHIKDICRRLAQLGYLAIAPELYARQGDVSKITAMPEIMPIVAKVPDAQVMSDLDSAVAWAAKNHGDVQRLGVTGFCWGGREVWLYAAHSSQLKAGVAWYGRIESAKDALKPKNPIDLAADLKAPVLGLYGGQDKGISQESLEHMRAAIKAAKKDSEIVVYPEAGHGFNADYRPGYNKAAAEDGWKKMLAWFRQHGVA